jgi:hypothetical protein
MNKMLNSRINLNTLLSMAVLLFSFNLQAQAEQAAPNRDAIKEAFQELATELNFTETQTTEVKRIEVQLRLQSKELRNQDLTPDEKRTRLQEIRKNQDQQLQSVLDENQYKKYMEWRKEQRMQQRPEGVRPSRRPEGENKVRKGKGN